MTTVAPFKNQHLSYSRLSRFETCPLSYRELLIDFERKGRRLFHANGDLSTLHPHLD